LLKGFWQEGRQGTGYFKHLLARGTSWDLYLLKYPKGSFVPGHVDPVEGFVHRRINLVFWNASEGGDFWARGLVKKRRRFVCFRSDIMLHGVDKVTKGVRYVLSLGFVTPNVVQKRG
jgi:hypothetical protein